MSDGAPQATGLIDRVRTALPEDGTREIRMFGGVSFMVGGAMAVVVNGDKSVLVRVDPAVDATLLTRPHAFRAEMGAGRSMGPGWIRVDEAGLRDGALDAWLAAALEYLARIPRKKR